MHGDLTIRMLLLLNWWRSTKQLRWSSDAYIESGSFLRFKNISLGYTLPKQFLEKLAWKNYVSIPHYKTISPLQNALA